MNRLFRNLVRDAAKLTQVGRLAEATAAIQRALRARSDTARHPSSAPRPAQDDVEVIDIDARIVEPALRERTRHAPPAAPAAPGQGAAPEVAERRPAAGRFVAGSYTGAAGTRPYKLFVPGDAAQADAPRPLLVMLHGCKQDPDDFAAGTRMNERAGALGYAVLYPGQTQQANGSGCWNWFQPGDQQRGDGEPAILAGMVRHVVATEGLDASRIFVVGLSAGGAMAATLASAYPELFAGLGVHSGLPPEAAHDLVSAFAAMRQGSASAARAQGATATPTIVFHGDRDATVHPSNGEAVIAWGRGDAASPIAAAAQAGPAHIERGRAPGGRDYTVSRHLDAEGRPWAEHWLVHGAGHAWSGGSAAGSYTDPKGPDASAAMLRFFGALRRGGG